MRSKNRFNYRLTNDYIVEKLHTYSQKQQVAIGDIIDYRFVLDMLERESNFDYLDPVKDGLYDVVEKLMNQSHGTAQSTMMMIQIQCGIHLNINGIQAEQFSEYIKEIIESLTYLIFFKNGKKNSIQDFFMNHGVLSLDLINNLQKDIKRMIYESQQISVLTSFSLCESNLSRLSRNYSFFEKLYWYSIGDNTKEDISDYLKFMGKHDELLQLDENIKEEFEDIVVETFFCCIIQNILYEQTDLQTLTMMQLLHQKYNMKVVDFTDFDSNWGQNTDGGQFLYDQFDQYIFEYNKNQTTVGDIFKQYITHN